MDQNKSKRHLEAEYDYTDESGNMIFQTMHFFAKDFRQRQRDEKGGWRRNLNGVKFAPFRPPLLIQAVKGSRAHGEQSRGERTDTGQGRGSVSARAAGRKGCFAKFTVIRLLNGCLNGAELSNRNETQGESRCTSHKTQTP
jgi:hypothetical protein